MAIYLVFAPMENGAVSEEELLSSSLSLKRGNVATSSLNLYVIRCIMNTD
jgi:hypothetical protein